MVEEAAPAPKAAGLRLLAADVTQPDDTGIAALLQGDLPGSPAATIRPSRTSNSSTSSTVTGGGVTGQGGTAVGDSLSVPAAVLNRKSRRESWTSNNSGSESPAKDRASVRSGRPSLMNTTFTTAAVSNRATGRPSCSEIPVEPGWIIRQRQCARAIGDCVESRPMIAISVIFTIYALFGDDFRLAVTERPMDNVFNVLALMCLVFFSTEIVLKCLSQSDYFLGFFFVLDTVATLSLILDLTWVSDSLSEGAVGEKSGSARSGRTARVGASLGRVVRVLRLVRVLKLYKAWFEQRTKKKRVKSTNLDADHDWDSDWDVDADGVNDKDSDGIESAVGRKLVALTTRKVILLVLLMLMALPFLMVPSSDLFNSSANWGVDSVWQAFVAYTQDGGSHEAYEQSLLKYVYFHNWFDFRRGCKTGEECSTLFYSHAFWIGLAGRSMQTLRDSASSAQISASAVDEWEASLEGSGDPLYSMGSFPPEARQTLWGALSEDCYYGGFEHLGFSILQNEIGGLVDHTVRCPTDLRPVERFRTSPLLITQEQFDEMHIVFFFDMRPFVKQGAEFGIITTIFVCIVLSLASISFSSDANNLVLTPIERMIAKVNKIRDDPLQAIKMADAVFEVEEANKHRQRRRTTRRATMFQRSRTWRGTITQVYERLSLWLQTATAAKEEEAVAETAILEKTIIKLGTLLALGFGHAGVNIVSGNMSALDSAGVNAMIPGVCVDCIIGYVKIKNFSTATEVLQTKIMTFVNQIAEIVHGLVNEYHGAANKNSGETFLIIWRLEGNEAIETESGPSTRLADMSVVAFARILGQVHMSPVLARYREHPGLQQRMGSRARVDLSFGMHLGWAIEGAVGTDFKIDASYVSPNVSVAESLERAAHVYGVHLLLSECVVDACSPSVASCCRLIDKAFIRGSKAPLQLHTLDLDVSILEVEERDPPFWNTRQRFRARQMLEVEKKRRLLCPDLMAQAEEVSAMRSSLTVEFFQYFNMGYQNYSQGEWQVARRLLTKTKSMLKYEDGPCRALLAFMQKTNFEPPANWNGVRDSP